MRTRTLSLLLIAALGGIGVASARADQRPSEPKAGPPAHDDVQVTVPTGKGRLGISAIQISPELRSHLGAPGDRGVLVDAVRPDSPAARAGLQVGDVVTEVDGDATRSASDVLGALSDRRKGDEVAVVAIRNGRRVDLRVKLDTDPGPTWQSRGFRGFERLPGDMNGWFPLEGSPQELRGAIEELRKRIEALEHRLEQRPSPRQGLDRI